LVEVVAAVADTPTAFSGKGKGCAGSLQGADGFERQMVGANLVWFCHDVVVRRFRGEITPSQRGKHKITFSSF